MNLVLFDDPDIRVNLLPFTFTRPVASIRVGILTIAEKWEGCLERKAFFPNRILFAEEIRGCRSETESFG
jgi:hypothetical protein